MPMDGHTELVILRKCAQEGSEMLLTITETQQAAPPPPQTGGGIDGHNDLASTVA